MPVFSWNTMVPFGKTVSQGFNLTEMCVEYEPFSRRSSMSKGGGHTFQPGPIRLPKPIPESFISMTGLTVKQFREMESKINGIIQEANGVNEEDPVFYQDDGVKISDTYTLSPSYFLISLIWLIMMQQ
jgi:hypothetical protein